MSLSLSLSLLVSQRVSLELRDDELIGLNAPIVTDFVNEGEDETLLK